MEYGIQECKIIFIAGHVNILTVADRYSIDLAHEKNFMYRECSLHEAWVDPGGGPAVVIH